MKMTKKEMVYNELKKRINSGEIAPGDKITISDQAKKYKVSEIPVREAIHLLASEGLVELTPHAGATVVSLTKNDVSEIFQLRIEFESLATKLAVNNLSNAHLLELDKIIEQSIEYVSNQDFKGYRQSNRKFHETIYLHCGNSRLRKIISELWESSARYPMPFITIEQIKLSVLEHKEIVEALRNRDELLTEKLVREHKDRSLKEILENFEDDTKKLVGVSNNEIN